MRTRCVFLRTGEGECYEVFFEDRDVEQQLSYKHFDSCSLPSMTEGLGRLQPLPLSPVSDRVASLHTIRAFIHSLAQCH